MGLCASKGKEIREKGASDMQPNLVEKEEKKLEESRLWHSEVDGASTILDLGMFGPSSSATPSYSRSSPNVTMTSSSTSLAYVTNRKFEFQAPCEQSPIAINSLSEPMTPSTSRVCIQWTNESHKETNLSPSDQTQLTLALQSILKDAVSVCDDRPTSSELVVVRLISKSSSSQVYEVTEKEGHAKYALKILQVKPLGLFFFLKKKKKKSDFCMFICTLFANCTKKYFAVPSLFQKKLILEPPFFFFFFCPSMYVWFDDKKNHKRLFTSELNALTKLNDVPGVIGFVCACCCFRCVSHCFFCPQTTLKGWIKQEHTNREIKAKLIIRQLLKTLMEMHEQNIVHRDIKPENVVFVQGRKAEQKSDEDNRATNGKVYGEVKFIDFGEAAFVNDDTLYYHLVGTPCYLAPERFRKHCGWELKGINLKKYIYIHIII
ncbi:hypothetical protein RFI_19712 [Reticulomyxa filosa]|uniref:Protein kinase domain-containing protein n=1 Tax=Reticulomyxa filosa TaxID=46433 RepID=X6MWZ5_RETFI|nr:hypothetical protein RFI_19712 [Reticulomyxa filosa]|eukprot:ETO17610.1 hypothetical protein RFI_19712 [Reticulomyxa filosa]